VLAERAFDQEAFALALGLARSEIDARTSSLIDNAQMRFIEIPEDEQARLREETRSRIEGGFRVVGEHRSNVWRDVWQEQLERFEASGYDIAALNPKFVDGSTILRWQDRYIRGVTPRFELLFMEILRDWTFRRWLGDVGSFFEFGSGSAFNVAAYARFFPGTPATALDWAPAAVRIAELLHERCCMKVRGQRFDFFAPSADLELDHDAGVYTMCALEQIGDRFGAFLDYLLEKKPRRVVHIEPTLELYDPALEHDRLAIAYHTQRKYLQGLLPALTELADERRIRLLYSRRLRFGSRFHECMSVHVWEPAA
jgi:hypothetical protein